MSGYIGNAPTAVPLTSADIADGIITSAKIADGTIVNADINASAAIDASKLSGVTSDFVLLATTTASSSASISFDGYFSATYKNYVVILSDVFPASSSGFLRIRLRKSNTDITTSNYLYGGSGQFQHTGVDSGFKYYGTGSNDTVIRTMEESGTVNTSNYAYNQKIHIYNPLATNTYKIITQEIGLVKRASETNYVMSLIAGSGVLNDNTNAISGISFFMSTGNIASGNFKLYGIK